MAKITTLNNQTLDIVRKNVDAALVKVSEELGIKFKAGGIRYNGADNTFTLKVDGALLEAANGRTADITSAAVLSSLGVPMGTKLKIKKSYYEVVGYSPNKPKYCIQLKGLYGATDASCPLLTAKNCIVILPNG